MTSLLEQARARAAARRERQVTITIPELGLDLVCDVPTDMAVVERMQNEAKKFDKGQARATHFARALVASQTREIRIDGELLTVDGEPVAFRDPELWPELPGASDAKSAVVELVGADGDILAVASELMTEAGFGADDEDPI